MEVFIMVVQHNLSAMNSNRMLGITQGTLSKSTEKLSSGYKINRAADDAAGLAISEKMRKQIRGLTQASANAEDGISSVQTAEGALTEVHDMLQRMNELAVKSANGTNSEDDRSYIQDEIDQLSQEIDRVAETTKFNETYLLKGDTKNEDGMGYSLSYATVEDGMDGLAKFTSEDNTETGLSIGDVTISAPDSSKVTTDEANDLLKALRNQGVTISTYTAANGTETAVALSLNGSDAKSQFNIVDKGNSKFSVTNSKGEEVAELEVKGFDKDDTKAGLTQNVAAYTVNAALAKNDVLTLYDKDGNAISANKLDQYYAGTGTGKKAGDKGDAKSIAGAPKVYDALGKELDASEYADDNIVAIKDQTAALKLSFQVGADGTSNNKINISIDAMSAKGLGINGLKVDGTDGTNATDAIETISAAIKKVSTQRSALGAVQNRLEHTINNLDNIVENTTSAESQIRDTDMATEMVKYSNANILSQAGQSMLAQSNQSNQGVLSLLG
jgi:flagellin